MPLNSGGGSNHIDGAYNDVSRDMYYYSGNAIHRDHHINLSDNAGFDDVRIYKGQGGRHGTDISDRESERQILGGQLPQRDRQPERSTHEPEQSTMHEEMVLTEAYRILFERQQREKEEAEKSRRLKNPYDQRNWPTVQPPPRFYSDPLPNPTYPTADHKPQVLPEDYAGDGEEQSLEDEASEAAFVVCWPQGRSTPSSQTTRSPDDFPCFRSSWYGGCVLSVHDSDFVDTWIDLNYDHRFLVLLREKRVGGPVASMLSVESPALTIFGAMSVELIRMANELAELSGLPVIVRPLEEDPSPRFRNYKHSTLATTPNTDGGGDGNTGQNTGTRSSFSAHSNSQNQRANNQAGGAKTGNFGKQRQDDTGSEDEGEDPSDPAPLPLPVPPTTKGEIIHRADITLTVLINNEDKSHFLRVITNAKTYPLPNSKTQSENKGGKKVASEPSIQGHVYLETRSSESIQIDVAAGSVGFLANDPDYLRTEYLVSLGYDPPPRKVNIENSSQISKSLSTSFGLVGGKPTAAFGLSAGKLTGTMTGLTDEEVAKPWIVSPQHGNDNWETDGSCYRSLSTNIKRSPPEEYQAPKHPMIPDINVEYGMAVEVAEPISKETPPVSFVYRHQIHCWVAVESKAKVRGLIVLTAHYIPDICTEKPLWISSRPSMNITCKDVQQDGSSSSRQVVAVQDGNTGLLAGGTSDDRFIFSAATMPEPDVGTKPLAFFNRLLSGGWNAKGRKEVEVLPMHGLVFQGWNCKDIGWDHRGKRWYHPVWQKLDPALLPDELRVKWKLDWEH